MKRVSKKLVSTSSPARRRGALGTLALAACTLGGAAGCNGDNSGDLAERQPYRDGWATVVDQAFDHTAPNEDGDEVAAIFQLAIGGRETNDNFANRGDIIVNFDGPADRILIEMRRFTFAASSDEAERDFEDLLPWAATGSVVPPGQVAEEDKCIKETSDSPVEWQNDCAFRVYFDGQSQLKRSGADIRVTLPADYRYGIDIVTQDNIEEEDYLNRGNVCVSNLFASANVDVDSGRVWASLAGDVNPIPRCPLEDIMACENWTQEDENGNEVPAPWAPECDCFAGGSAEFGRLTIESSDENAADVVVDVPAGLWTSVKAENTGMGQQSSGDHCEATIELSDYTEAETGNDFPWQAQGFANYPGPPATAGAGYSVQITSKSCEPVAYTETPDEFVGIGKGDDQTSEERGNVQVCTNCIAQSCDELIP